MRAAMIAGMISELSPSMEITPIEVNDHASSFSSSSTIPALRAKLVREKSPDELLSVDPLVESHGDGVQPACRSLLGRAMFRLPS